MALVFKLEPNPSFEAESPNPEPLRSLWVLPNARIFYDRSLSYNLLFSAKSKDAFSPPKFHLDVTSAVALLYILVSIFIPLLSFWQHLGRAKKWTPVANQVFKTEIHHMSSKTVEPQKRKQSGFDSFLSESSLPLAQTCLFTSQEDNFPRPKAMSRKTLATQKHILLYWQMEGIGGGVRWGENKMLEGTRKKGAKEAMTDYID